jgi:Spermine/spermidine synthase domain
MRFRPRQGLLAGVAVLAAGAVVLEIALARTTAALLGQHLALAAPALALFGAGLGGALAAALPGLVRRRALLARLAHLAGLAAGATLLSLLVLVHVKVPDVLDRAALGPLAIVYLSAALPFVLVGVACAGAVRHVPGLGGRVVFAIFAGAALGGPLALGALRAGAPRVGLVVMVMDAVAALLFYLGARGGAAPDGRNPVQRPRGALVATFLLASGVLLVGDLGAPWLKLPPLRFVPVDKSEVQEWSVLGLLTVDRASAGVAWMHTDGTASVPIYEGKTTVPVAPDEMGYVLHRERGPVAVIGGGGGREVRVALKYAQKEIHAVDLDPIAVHALVEGRLKKASADVYDGPAVVVTLAEGDGYARRSEQPFRNIVLALPDTQGPAAAGVTAALPVDLYTVEAFTDLLGDLTPDGTLVATRWDAEIDRLLGLAAAALRRSGVADPSPHLFACSAARSTALLIARSPLEPREVQLLRKFCRDHKLAEQFAPDQPHGEPRRRLAAGLGPIPGEPLDLRPPSADRPFFAFTLPADQIVDALRGPKAATGAQGLRVLAGLLAVAAGLVFFAVGLPLAAAPRSPVGRLGPLLFFTGLGAGVAFAGAALFPRLVGLLGHPLYAYTTVAPALLASIGGGGLVVARARAAWAERSAGLRAEILVAVLAAAVAGLGLLVDAALGLPFAARVAVVLAILVPVGMLVGSLLALGFKIVAARSPALLPWCWGMAGVGAFVAATVAIPLAVILGYGAVLLAAGASVLLAAVCVPRAS